MTGRAHCWSCGAVLDLDTDEPVGRSTTCDLCDADVRTCLGCVFYALASPNACREPSAEPVSDKERANFCGFFRLRLEGPAPGRDSAADDARRRLEALFAKR